MGADIDEPTVLRVGSPELDDLLDDLDRRNDIPQRPIIVRKVLEYVVWVDAEYDGDDEELAAGHRDWPYDLVAKDDEPFEAYIDVEAVGDRWDVVYDPDGEDFGPVNAPVQGPSWRCPERYCGGYHPARATWPRRHGPHCPHHEPKPVAA